MNEKVQAWRQSLEKAERMCRCNGHLSDADALIEIAAFLAAAERRPELGAERFLHPATSDLVDRFAAALKRKLYEAEGKYGYSDGWRDTGWLDECRAKLREHVEKGDPRDVAAYCAFLWHHGASTADGNGKR